MKSGPSDLDGKARVWSATNFEVVKTYEFNEFDQLISGALLHNNGGLMVGTAADSLKVADHQGSVLQSFALSSKLNTLIKINAETERLIGEPMTVQLLWFQPNGRIINQVDHINQMAILSMAYQNGYLITGSINGSIYLWPIRPDFNNKELNLDHQLTNGLITFH